VIILLEYPNLPDTFWSFNHAFQFIREETVASLGLDCLEMV